MKLTIIKKILSSLLILSIIWGVMVNGSVKANLSTDAPFTTINIIGNQGLNGIYYGNVMVELIAVASKGVSSTQYKLKKEDSWKTYSAPFTLTPSKAYEVYYRTTDNSGNIEETKVSTITVKVDTFPPESEAIVLGDPPSSGFYNRSVSVQLKAVDPHSGISYSEYSLNNGQSWVRYSSPFEISDSGPNLVHYRSIDNSGNAEKSNKLKISLDLILPSEPSISFDPVSWTNSSVSVEITKGDDEGSGSRESQYRIGNGEWTEYTLPFIVTTNQIINARTVDYAGNMSEITSSPALIDVTGPPAPFINFDNDWSDGPVIVDIMREEESESLVREIQYQIGLDDDEWLDYNYPFQVVDEGLTSIRARSVDWAGNVGSEAEDFVKIDNTPPNKPTINLSRTNWTNEDVTFTVTHGVDTLSGVSRSQYKVGFNGVWIDYDSTVTYTDEGTETIYARTIDQVGLISEESTAEIKIDRTPPTRPEITVKRTGLPWKKISSIHFALTDARVSITSGTDITSGAHIQYKLGDDGVWSNYTGELTLTNANYVVYARTVDGAGNTSNPDKHSLSGISVVGSPIYGIKASSNGSEIQLSTPYEVYKSVQLNSYSWQGSTERVTIYYTNYYYDSTNSSATTAFDVSDPRLVYYFDTEAPSNPQQLKVVDKNNTSISLSWAASTDNKSVVGYNIYSSGKLIGTTDTPEYTASNLIIDKVYKLTVKSVDSSGNLSDSSEVLNVLTYDDIDPPSVPQSLAVIRESNGALKLTWEPSVDNIGVYGYDVYQYSELIGSTRNTSFPLQDLVPNTEYQWSVVARDAEAYANVSSASIPILYTTGSDLQAPSIPSRLMIKSKTENTVTLGWNASTDNVGVASYTIYQDGVKVGISSETEYTVHGLLPDLYYKFNVSANDAMENESNVSSEYIYRYHSDEPTFVSVVPSSTTLDVSWAAVTGASSYDVEINGAITTRTNLNYTKTALPSNTEYIVRVRAKYAEDNGDWSNLIITKTLLATPSVSAISTSSQISFSWAAIEGANEYEVEVDGQVINVGTDVTTFVHEDLLPSTSHTYKVRAKNIDNASMWSYALNKLTTPAVVTGVNVVPTNSTLVVSWSATPGATGYWVEFSTGTTETIGTSSTSLTKTGLSLNKSYKVRVSARNSGGNGEWSEPVTTKTLLNTPIVTSVSSSNEITLSWASVLAATEYEVEANGIIVSTSSDTTFKHVGLTPTTTYNYRVRAKNSDNYSSWSAAITNSTMVSVPAGINITPSSTSLLVNWESVTGATGYDIEINGTVTGITSTSYSKTSLPANTNYAVRVRAKSSKGNGDWSTLTTTKTLLATPTVTSVSTSNQITLNWSAITGASEYEVEVDGSIVSDVIGTTYQHADLLPNTVHAYKVRAKNSGNLSAWSSAISKYTAPTAVPIVNVVPTSTTLVITWPTVTGATGYDVEINGAVTSSTSTSLTKSSLTTNTDYTVRLRSKNTGGASEWSSPVTVKTLLVTPTVTAVSTNSQITLSWAAITGASEYDVEVDGVVVNNVTGTTYQHTDLSPSTTHTYKVRAKSVGNESAWSTSVSKFTTPAQVTGVNVVPTSSTLIITWPAVTGATGYDVEINGAVTANTDTSYTKTTLIANTEYTVRVRAKNVGGVGEWSAPVVLRTLLATPTVTTVSTSSQITLSWAAITGASEYDVEVDGVVINNITGTTYQHTDLSPSTTHTYKVRAKNVGNESAWSTSVSKFTTPAHATGVNVVPTSTTLVITWPAVTGATGYDVEINGAVTSSTSTSLTKSSLTTNTDYTVRLRSKNTGGASEWSSPVTVKTLLVTPTVTAVSTNSQITLSWAAITGASEYEVEVDGVVVNNVTGTTYQHTDLAPSTTHTYKVRAKSVGNESAWSTSVSKFTTPDQTAGVNVVPTSTTLVITWPAVTGATGYDVEINGAVTSSTSTSLTKSSLTTNTDYTVRIRSKNTGGTSEWSLPVTVKTLLATPTVTTVSTSNQITLSWAAIAGASEYEVDVDGVVVNNVTGTTYQHMDLAPSTTHTYKVRAKSVGNESAWSTSVSKFTTPDQTAGVNVVPTSTTLVITWPAVTGATGYDVEINGAVTVNTSTSYTKTTLTANTEYTVRVRAKNAGGAGEWSASVVLRTLLATPTVTTVSTSNQITLSWAAIAGASEYEVEVDGVVVNNVTGTTYQHTDLAPSTTHTYKVRAKSVGNESAWSTSVSKFTTPDQTAGVNVVPTSTTLVITWSAVTGATGYDVEINGAVTVNTSTSYTKTTLTANTEYTVRVRAKNAGGAGEWSASVVLRTLLATPTVTTVSTSNQITLSWAAIAGASEYEVEVDGVVVNNVTGTTYQHTDLSPSTTHTYKVRAKSVGNESAWSTSVSKMTTPAQATGINVVPTSTTLVITWPAITGATGYDVEIDGAVNSKTSTSYTKTTLIANTEHTVRVRAKNAGGAGEWSASVVLSTLLATPTVTTVSTSNQITLSWAAIAGASEYEVEVDGVVVNNVTGTTYQHTDLTPSTTHTYKVRAKNVGNESAWSISVSKMTTPAQVTGVNVVPTSTTLVITWSAITGATGYDVEINGSITANTSTSFTKASLSVNTVYTIRVRAKNTGGTGDWSTPLVTKTL